MDARLHADITSRLERDFAFKRHGDWLQQGVCPSCNKKELYTSAEHPWVLRCNRLNNCNHEEPVRELYADLFESWSERFPRTPELPNATADGYMDAARGFTLDRVKGWYRQENYWDHEKEIGSATVRFRIADGVWWERIIDRPHRFGKRKANFGGEYGGLWWAIPNLDLAAQEEIWLVEGIFDAIALWHNGKAAASTLSTVNYPADALKALREQVGVGKLPRLIWAYDGDKAGRSFTKKWVARAREEGWNATAAQIPQRGKKRDWNDLHLLGRLSDKDIEDYRYYGALLLAASAIDKAVLMYSRNGLSSFSFDFDNQLYWFKLDLDAFNKAVNRISDESVVALTDVQVREKALLESGQVDDVATCAPSALYYQANAVTDESWYYFRIDFPGDKSVKNTFTGGQLSSPSEFKKRLLSIAPGAVWTGSAGQLDFLIKRWLRDIKTVQTIDFIGYAKEHATYVFGDLAVRAGKTYERNDEDFFEIGKLSLKSLSQSVNLSINPDLKAFRTDWLNRLWTCFGAKGIVALAFWLGGLFAEQIRDKQKSFPFLEVVGEAGAGKSTLIEFLWKLVGRSDYEGFDPAKATAAARARNFAQTANLPVVLIESDREAVDSAAGRPAKSFDWDELKTAYNGRSVRSRGMRNNGNETYEPPFRGAIVISQNATVSASDAVMQRICHLYFDRSGQNEASKTAAAALETMSMTKVSGFALKAALAEKEILDLLDKKFPEHERRLVELPGVRHIRIAKNHGQLMALVDALGLVLQLPEDMRLAAHAHLEAMAVERQQAINADHPLVQDFWETFDYLDGDEGEPQLNHSRDAGLIAVNLNHFEQLAAERKLKTPPLSELKRVLKTSRSRKFIDVRTVNSAIYARHNGRGYSPTKPTTLKCWVFDPGHKR
ncbi:MAG: toprim domain-containing protein [Gammaproteobacteria bacterium]|nr:toprim domain-containing protein [Gammaproteobacteria bacterium]